MKYIAIPLNALMQLCFELTGGYVPAILLFTLLTKVILFPVSMWTQRNGIKMVEIMPAVNELKIRYFGDKDKISDETQKLYKKVNYHPLESTVPLIIQIVLLIGVISAVNTMIGGSDSTCAKIPWEKGGAFLLMPFAAGISALCLGLAQNRLSPLQREQSRGEQIMTNGVSVAISLLLGAFVSVGTCIYWICSNLLSILNQIILNKVVNPKKYVDYTALAESRKKLAEYNSASSSRSKADRKREKQDYKKFFSVLNKHLVFYSESSGFYKYFKGFIDYILEHTNIIIHYITSDPNDQVFELAKAQPRIHPYYIAEKRLITLMMKLDCDVMIMTMPDLENYHIKRSYIRKDIEYICVQHGIGSLNLMLRKGAEDHYDTVFCCGQHQYDEFRESEELYKLPEKKLIKCGYCLLDEMIAEYNLSEQPEHEKKQILIAPSWQKDNIVESCLEQIIDGLKDRDYSIIVRPHPQHVRHMGAYMDALKMKYHDNANVEIQTDFSSNKTIFESDLVITDWSSIAYEFAFTTKKPVLFVNTPMKIMNPDYDKISVVPMNIELRNIIGCDIELDALNEIGEKADMLLKNREKYYEAICQQMEEKVYNVGHSAEVGAEYIINAIQKKIESRRREN